MLSYFKKGKNTTETQTFCAAYGEGAVTECVKVVCEVSWNC